MEKQSEPTAAPPPMLEMRGITKTFPGVKALSNVDLKVWSGEVLALMGENGAGKSTLMKILSGAYHADPGGEIRLDGEVVHITDPHIGRKLGIAIIYQELSLAPNLTVAENIHLGDEPRQGPLVDRAAMAEGCKGLLDRLGVTFGPNTVVGNLSIAEQQLVEIARALHVKSKVLVMDEPTTALSNRETEKLFQLIHRLRDEGLAIIYITHRMAEVYELADRVSVLRDGTYVGTLGHDEVNPETVVRMMVGRKLDSFYIHRRGGSFDDQPVVLDVRGLTDRAGRVQDASFVLRRGEVLGLGGLVGSGRTELARLIYGADRRSRGSVLLDGEPADMTSSGESLKRGIAYLTEDRKRQGLFLDMSVKDNVNIGVVKGDALISTVLNFGKARERAAAAIRSLSIRVPHALVNVGALSGGNQQKVLLSRWLETCPKVLILDEPTRGVDVGAKAEIYRIIDDLAKKGVAILAISSELPELIGISDRILVMREGHIVGEAGGTSGVEPTQENIIAIATGAVSPAAAA
jgi:ribose transport system ATP-binding protein